MIYFIKFAIFNLEFIFEISSGGDFNHLVNISFDYLWILSDYLLLLIFKKLVYCEKWEKNIKVN